MYQIPLNPQKKLDLLADENKENYELVCNTLDLLTDKQVENIQGILEC